MNITDVLFARSLAGGGGGNADRWSSYGRNPKFIKKYDLPKVYLKDTGYATWTPGAVSGIIATAAPVDTLTTDVTTYDYVCVLQMQMFWEYGSGATNTAKLITNVVSRTNSVCGYYLTPEALEQGIPNASTMGTDDKNELFIFYNTSGVRTIGKGDIGFWTSSSLIQSVSTSSCNIVVPEIRVTTSTTSFSSANAAAVDQAASYYKPIIYVYPVDKGTSITGKSIEMMRKTLLATQ